MSSIIYKIFSLVFLFSYLLVVEVKAQILFEPDNSQDTLSIIVVRVEFLKDSILTTSGDGSFLRETDNNFFKIDPPPYNIQYIKYHFDFAKDYFYKVSNTKLVIKYNILPNLDLDVYRLSKSMAYYSPLTKDLKLKEKGLIRFIKDVFDILKSDNEFMSIYNIEKFKENKDYKTILCIFHAGASGITDVLDSSNNILDSYFSEYDFERYNSIIGVPLFKNVMIIPERMVHDKEEYEYMGINPENIYQFSINSIIIYQIYRSLGALSLYNTDKGYTQVGVFSPLDVGGFLNPNSLGISTPYLDAWNRYYLGWCDTNFIVTNDSLYVLDTNKVGVIDINNKEFYLISYRKRPKSIKIYYRENSLDPIEKEITIKGSVDNLLENFTNGNFKGIITKVEGYDWILPSSGGLVWYVNRDIINKYFTEDRINTEEFSGINGVELIEQDRNQSIGYDEYYNFYGEKVFDYGTEDDMFSLGDSISLISFLYDKFIDTKIFFYKLFDDSILVYRSSYFKSYIDFSDTLFNYSYNKNLNDSVINFYINGEEYYLRLFDKKIYNSFIDDTLYLNSFIKKVLLIKDKKLPLFNILVLLVNGNLNLYSINNNDVLVDNVLDDKEVKDIFIGKKENSDYVIILGEDYLDLRSSNFSKLYITEGYFSLTKTFSPFPLYLDSIAIIDSFYVGKNYFIFKEDSLYLKVDLSLFLDSIFLYKIYSIEDNNQSISIDKFFVLPNPIKRSKVNRIKFFYSLTQKPTKVNIVIYNLEPKKVLTLSDIPANIGYNTYILPINSLKNDLYIAKIVVYYNNYKIEKNTKFVIIK